MATANASALRSNNYVRLRLRPNQAPASIVVLRASGRTENALKLVAVEDSTHLFMGMVNGVFEGDINVCAYGNLIKAYVAPMPGNKSAVYYDVSQRTWGIRKEILSQMTRHTSGLYDSIDFEDPVSPKRLLRKVEGQQGSGWQLHEAMSARHTKITASHHVHFSFKEVVDILGVNSDSVALALSITREATNSFLTGVALWAAGLTTDEMMLAKGSGLFSLASVKDYKREAKRISVEAKSLQNLVDVDLRKFFELEVLVNRVDGLVNWEEEHKNRVSPNLAEMPEGLVYERASQLFSRSISAGKRPRKFDWREYWQSRWQWSAAGSIHSQYSEDDKYIFKDIYLKNKFISILAMPDMNMDSWREREPELHAWSSTKYEWSKLRAIYGTDVTSYVMAHFAFYNCEDVLPSPFPVGKAANDENVRSRVRSVLEGRTQYCVDFEDFNSQHSVQSMKAVIDAYRDTFGHFLTQEQLAAVEWTRLSLDRVIVHDNQGLKMEYNAKGTLLSGWRLTTFMNSVLNYIYTQLIVPDVVQSQNSLHNGDDVLLGSNSLEDVLLAGKNAKKHNIRLQTSKCAYGAIAEFLRVDHKRGSKGQYLSRAMATLVHSRIESKPSSDMRDLLEALESRLDDSVSRGMPMWLAASLRNKYYSRQCERLHMTVSDCYRIKTSHRCVGGISEDKRSDVKWMIRSSGFRKGATQIGVLPGVVDYSRMVKASLQLERPLQDFISRIMRATYDAVIPKERNINVSRNGNIKRYEILRALFKVHKEETDIVNYGKAKMTGFLMDVLNGANKSGPLLHLLNGSKDPMELIGIVT